MVRSACSLGALKEKRAQYVKESPTVLALLGAAHFPDHHLMFSDHRFHRRLCCLRPNRWHHHLLGQQRIWRRTCGEWPGRSRRPSYTQAISYILWIHQHHPVTLVFFFELHRRSRHLGRSEDSGASRTVSFGRLEGLPSKGVGCGCGQVVGP